MSAEVIVLRQPFDPSEPEAERRYDDIVVRINRLSAERERNRRTCVELERQFVQNDLCAKTEEASGEPLTETERRKRLIRLIDASCLRIEQDKEYDRLCTRLDEMNQDLDEWARQYWAHQGEGE
ncbi:MAG: hypothetical protein CBC48_09565 [bacterium TMED88]|nr:hypothetical protein [Deltaproteobacteria bacterium]MDG2050223.1 hypothetical protein [Myxococcota bacterium]OUV31646.1 MAG: hypothetical protein CBC48_09565 [bacterium TMED88]